MFSYTTFFHYSTQYVHKCCWLKKIHFARPSIWSCPVFLLLKKFSILFNCHLEITLRLGMTITASHRWYCAIIQLFSQQMSSVWHAGQINESITWKVSSQFQVYCIFIWWNKSDFHLSFLLSYYELCTLNTDQIKPPLIGCKKNLWLNKILLY